MIGDFPESNIIFSDDEDFEEDYEEVPFLVRRSACMSRSEFVRNVTENPDIWGDTSRLHLFSVAPFDVFGDDDLSGIDSYGGGETVAQRMEEGMGNGGAGVDIGGGDSDGKVAGFERSKWWKRLWAWYAIRLRMCASDSHTHGTLFATFFSHACRHEWRPDS